MKKYEGQISYKVIIITIKDKEQKKKIPKHNKSMLERHSLKQIKTITYHFKRSLKALRKDIKYKEHHHQV